ncbi:MAG TPA: hypothetical protein VJN95_05425 [Gemmatimonadales bacterium]|nr:hypothetical protein [Gemmatimonadales bacterium]
MRRLAGLIALMLMAVPARAAVAQATVTPLRNLTFGPVIQGIPKHILPSDATRSGEYQFIAPLASNIRIAFTLPTRLNGPTGATMPISFSTTDGIAQGTASNSVPATFNPNVSNQYQLVTSNRILVWIGGTVSPAANQRTGSYTGTVTMTITIL